jgi:hypothetical protein
MIQRSIADIIYPFIFTAGRMNDATSGAGQAACIGKNTSYQFNNSYTTYAIFQWPSYSLWSDGTKVSSHMHDFGDNSNLLNYVLDPVTGEDLLVNGLLAQWESAYKYAIIGEYRLIAYNGNNKAQHTVFGPVAEPWIEIAYEPATQYGIAMRWPPSVVPIW